MLDDILFIEPSNNYLHLFNDLTGPYNSIFSINYQLLMNNSSDSYLFKLIETSYKEKIVCQAMHDRIKDQLPIHGNVLFLVFGGDIQFEFFFINSFEFQKKFPSIYPVQMNLNEEELKIICENQANRKKHVSNFKDRFFPLHVNFHYDNSKMLVVQEKEIESWKKIKCGTIDIYIKALDLKSDQKVDQSIFCLKSYENHPLLINKTETKKSSRHRIMNLINNSEFRNKAKSHIDASNNKRSLCLSTIANSNFENNPESNYFIFS